MLHRKPCQTPKHAFRILFDTFIYDSLVGLWGWGTTVQGVGGAKAKKTLIVRQDRKDKPSQELMPSLHAPTQTRQHCQAVTTGTTPHRRNPTWQDGLMAPSTTRWCAWPSLWLSRLARPPGTSTSQSRIEALDTTTSKDDRWPESDLLPHYRHNNATRRIGGDDEGHGKIGVGSGLGLAGPCP